LTQLQKYLRPAVAGIKANLLPGFVLQVFAVAVLVGYFRVESVHRALTTVGVLKVRYGYLYGALSTALFGGFIPFLVLYLGGKIPRDRRGKDLTFYLVFWLWKGVEVDALYRGQSFLFGVEPNLTNIAAKTAVDQLGYTLFWSAPTQTWFFLWKDSDYSLSLVRQRLQIQPFLQRATVVVLSNWVVWVPAVAIVYSLPAPLQLPISNLILCFWCLLLSYVSRDSLNELASAPSSTN